MAGNEAVSSEIVASAYIENYAMKLFEWADKEDRASKFGKNVVKAFYTAGNLFDIMQVFGEITPEVAHARKYSKWKAAYIHNCLKNGETPVPGPVGNDEEGNDEDEAVIGAEGGGAGGWSQPQPQAPPEVPSISNDQPKAPEEPSQPQPSSSSTNTESADPASVMRAQKLCKFASSALDYDDVDTAIKNLTEALELLQKSKKN